MSGVLVGEVPGLISRVISQVFYMTISGGPYRNGISIGEVSFMVYIQWLEHQWLVYHVCFKLICESLGKIPYLQIKDNLGCFSFFYRVCTEIGKQNSRTFPELFKDVLPFFQGSFFIYSNSPNTAYMQNFFPIRDFKHISLLSSLFLPDFSSAYRLRTLLSFLLFRISTLQGFTSGCESNTMAALPLNTALHFLFYDQFHNSLDFCCALHPKICFYHFPGLFVIIREIFSKFQDNSRTNRTFFFIIIPGVFQDQGHFPGLFKVCANPVLC